MKLLLPSPSPPRPIISLDDDVALALRSHDRHSDGDASCTYIFAPARLFLGRIRAPGMPQRTYRDLFDVTTSRCNVMLARAGICNIVACGVLNLRRVFSVCSVEPTLHLAREHECDRVNVLFVCGCVSEEDCETKLWRSILAEYTKKKILKN